MDNIQFRAASAASRATDALAKARGAQEQVEDLRRQVDRLQMICEGMWSLMKARTGATEDELARLVEEIDLRDGAINGKTVTPPQNCARCGRVVSVQTSVCLYCGAQNFKQTLF